VPSAAGAVVVAVSVHTDAARPISGEGARGAADSGPATVAGGVTNKVLHLGHLKALGDADAPHRAHDFIASSSTP
jgi:hypothetical protein